MKKGRVYIYISMLLVLLSTFIMSCETSYNNSTSQVTFISSEGGVLKKISVKNGYKLQKSDFPVIEIPSNMDIDGWYNNTQPVKEGYEITVDTIVSYKLIKKQNQVSKVVSNITSDSLDYDKDRKIVLDCATRGATIYYSISVDNNEATSFAEYTKPISENIEDKVTVIAYATKEGFQDSEKTTINFNIKKYTVTFNKGSNLGDIEGFPNNLKDIKKGYVLTGDFIKDLGISPNSDLIFDSWKDQDGNQVNIGYEITKDTTITAQWRTFDTVESVKIESESNEIDFNETFSINLSTTTPDASIYYTLDGSDPTDKETTTCKLYTSPLSLQMKENITIKAKAYCNKMKPSAPSSKIYKLKTYKVTYANDKGESPAPISNLKKGDILSDVMLAKPSIKSEYKDAYIFDCWIDGNGNKVNVGYTITKDLVLTAKWDTLCSITYTSEYNTVPSKVTGIISGTKITKEQLPDLGINSSDDFIFNYWTYSNGKKVNVGDLIEGDLQLTAQWIEYVPVDKVTITNDPNKSSFDKGESFTVSMASNTPNAKIYYTINGDEVTNEESETNTLYSEPFTLTMDSKNIVINAQAYKDKMKPSIVATSTNEVKTYRITYSTSYGTAPQEKSDLLLGTELTEEYLPNLLTSNDGKKLFVNWIDDSGNVVSIGTKLTGNLTLNAEWRDYNATLPVKMSHITQFVDYKKPLSVSLICDQQNADIYYTLDGTEPTKDSIKYDGTPITIEVDENKNKIELKARSYSTTQDPSIVTKQTYTLKTYTITFDNKGYGIKPETITGKKNTDQIKVENLVDTNKEYKFLGWYIGNEKVIFPYTVTHDVTMTAKWEYNKVNDVTFDIFGASLDYSDKVGLSCATEGATIYYTTDGSIPNTNSKVYNNVDKVLVNPKAPYENFTIKAMAVKNGMFDSNVIEKTYAIKKYTISFASNGHGTSPNPITNKKKGDKITVSDISDPDNEYKFLGWNIDNQQVSFPYTVTQNVTMVAQWKYNKVSDVTFGIKGDSLDYSDNVALMCDTKGATIYYTTDGTIPSKEKSIKYVTGTPITVEPKDANVPFVIKAIAIKEGMIDSNVVEKSYNIKKYTVTFDNNGFGTKPESIPNLKKGDKVLLSSLEDLGKDETTSQTKVFVGWQKDNNTVTQDIIIDSDITLVAHWIDYIELKQVTFSKIGEVDYLDEITISYPTQGIDVDIYYTIDESDPSNVNNPNRILYEKPLQITENVAITACATHKYLTTSPNKVARYTMKTYTVRFTNDKNLENPNPIPNLKKNDTITDIPSLPLIGYDFKGWKDNEGKWFDSKYPIAKDITLTAVLEPLVYNITYVLNSDSTYIVNTNPTSYTVEDEIILKTNIRSSWKAEWYDNASLEGSPITSISKGSMENKTFYATWIDIAPSEVENLIVNPSDGKVTLSWDNPKDDDIVKVIITYGSNNPIEINIQPNTSTTKDIISLINGTSYNFTIKTVDKTGHQSEGYTTYAIPGIIPYNFTETPKLWNSINYDGKSYDIVIFGDWPQTLYKGATNILKPCNNINAWDNCYTDCKGNFYVKVNAKPYGSSYKYSDGTKVESGKDYYFKLEPIQWRVLTDDYNGKKLLLAEKALANCRYFEYESSDGRIINGKTIYRNNYRYSKIRAFLNGYDYINPDNTTNTVHNNKGFLQKAFTKNAIEKIADTLVDNSAESTTDSWNLVGKATKYVCENTIDKIFLLSEKEATTASYGFDRYDMCGEGSKRKRESIDYALATGIYVHSDYIGSNKSQIRWWLRSPVSGYDTYYVNSIDYDGYADYRRSHVNHAETGVVPALSISF